MQNIINLHKLIRQFNKLGNKLGVGKNKMSLKDAFTIRIFNLYGL